jgi:hypothetical protein
LSDKDLKIAVCMHAFRDVDFAVYFNHLWCIGDWARNHDILFCGKRGLDAATARNQIAKMAIDQNCTHLFFIDQDHLFPQEALDILLQSKDEAMVSGVVCKRGDGYNQVGFQRVEKGPYYPLDLPLDGRLYQVRVCAFGCTLISVHHLTKLKKPYFRDTCHPAPEGPLYNYRSDVNLCEAFFEIGEKCWVDTRLLVGHHGYDNIIYPQQAKVKTNCDSLLMDSLKLRSGQEGLFYDF